MNLERVIFEESAEMAVHENILHRPLANDTTWNGSAFVILTNNNKILHSGKDGVKTCYYSFTMFLRSNTEPAIDNLTLIGISRDQNSPEEKESILDDIPYHSTAEGLIKIFITQPKTRLDDLYHNYNFLLEAENAAGNSKFPIILELSNCSSHDGIEDRIVLLAILLPCALVVVGIALFACICQSYR